MSDPEPRPPASAHRAILARTAFAGGLLSIFTSLAMLRWQVGSEERNVDSALFFVCWSAVALCTLLIGTLQLRRDARRRGEPPASPKLKLAIRSATPSLLAGAAITACLTLTTGLPLLPAIFWLVFYGLALLSTLPFTAQSVTVLGWAFLFSGIAAFFYLMYESIMPEFDLPTPTRFCPAALMGVTFGLYHLVFAAWTWPRRGQRNG